MFKLVSGLLLAGLSIAPVFAEDEARIESSDVRSDESLRSERVQTDTRAAGAPVREERRTDGGDRADRSGPVPFADIGQVGGKADESVLSQKAIDQDKRLLVRGEVKGDDLILHLPEGTKIHTLSLRSNAGLDIKHDDLMKIWRVDGNDMTVKLSELKRFGDVDTGNLWVWGTGPESSSLLQRVQLGETRVAGVSEEATEENEARSDRDETERSDRDMDAGGESGRSDY